MTDFTWLAAAIFAVALLYSSVGHAGASGYIAVLALAGMAPAEIRPVALTLNVLVAVIGTVQFARAGHFSWSLFWPFAVLAVPAAFLGGWLQLPTEVFQVLVGLVLWFSAVRLVWRKVEPGDVVRRPRVVALGSGAGIGFLSGLTGTGGGIFLTPLLLFCRWAHVREAAAVSALFILVNSSAGLAGYVSSGRPFPAFAWSLAAVAAIGGLVGSRLGSRHLPVRAIAWCLAMVLLLAGGKLVLG